MRGRDELFEIVGAAELGIYRLIIFDRVRAAKRALAVVFTNRMNGHQPKYIDAKFAQPRQVSGDGGEFSRRGILTNVDLVDRGSANPVRHANRRAIRADLQRLQWLSTPEQR